MATGTSLSEVFPLGSRLNERGRLVLGGCDVIELAEEFGTPAYVVAEDDLRARARAFLQSGERAGHRDFHVVFASKAFPCTAVLEVFAQEGLWCDVASGGELHLALGAGFDAQRLVLHGNAKSREELQMALGRRVGLIVIDNFDEIDLIERLISEEERAGVSSRFSSEPPQMCAERPMRRSPQARPTQSLASLWMRSQSRSSACAALRD